MNNGTVLTPEQIQLGMALAESMKVNDFAVQTRIKWFLKKLNRFGGRHIYVIHRGEGLVETDVSLDHGLKTFWLGDKNERYVFVRLHSGAKLEGIVSVKMYVTVENDLAKIVMDVWPVDEDDHNFAGTIWMANGFGSYSVTGSAPVFSVCRLTMDYPLAFSAGTLQGFSFGLVGFHDLGFDCGVTIRDLRRRALAILGEPEQEMSHTLAVTPFGAVRENANDEYLIGGTLPSTKPVSMPEAFFNLLRVMFNDGIKIVTKKRIVEMLAAIDIVGEKADKVLKRLEKMVEEEWFITAAYDGELYYVPTPKLLVVLK